MDPRLMRHYEDELTFLREMGNEFAAEYPKVAARLDVANAEVADPYVERLLEGFAFLTARIKLKMEAEFPTFTQSLLQMVYPHYLAPTPSMAIVRFTPDVALKGLPIGVQLPAGLELRSLLGSLFRLEQQCCGAIAPEVSGLVVPVVAVQAVVLGGDQQNAARATRFEERRHELHRVDHRRAGRGEEHGAGIR